MTSPSPELCPTPPDWPHCGHSEDPSTDPVGCRGILIPGQTVCLAHLEDADRAAYLGNLSPGADINHRGTPFTTDLLSELLAALTDSATGRPCLGEAIFEQATFSDDAVFDGAAFAGGAWFKGAEFDGNAVFGGVKFSAEASFLGAKFSRGAWFGGAEFHGDTWFGATEFRGNVVFLKAAFERAAVVGPLACTGTLDLSEAVFGSAVTIEAAAGAVNCRRTRWVSTAALRLRHAVVNLSDAVLEHPVSIAAHSRPFTANGKEMAEPGSLTGPGVRVVSLRGVDAAHLVLTDLDLTNCRFAGTIHLDQLRLEGLYTLAVTPSGLRRCGVWPVRWTPRRTLAEEHHWRATRFKGADGWAPPLKGDEVLKPAALAPVYRQLRKSFEDGKHEPGAADFYYGEMEMRRHADDIPWAERSLLTTYWALSGYGQRASRALIWLLATMTATVLAMMLWGLPRYAPKATSTATLTGTRSITITTYTPDPVNPNGPYHQRLSTERFEKSLRVVINSVVFRSSGQDLTTAGTYTEMFARLTEPVLLGLAVLAIRNRVKR
ncbi:pentapeptide repeat-containing protein [Streptomyces sp. NPDC020096]